MIAERGAGRRADGGRTEEEVRVRAYAINGFEIDCGGGGDLRGKHMRGGRQS